MSALLLLKEKLRLLEGADSPLCAAADPSSNCDRHPSATSTGDSTLPTTSCCSIGAELAMLRETCSETGASVLTRRAAEAREDLLRAGERLTSALATLSVDSSRVIAFVAAAEPSEPTDYLRDAPLAWIEVDDNVERKCLSLSTSTQTAHLRHLRRVYAMQTASATWLEHMYRRKRRALLDIDEALELNAFRQSVEEQASELEAELMRSAQDEDRLGRLRLSTVVDDEMCHQKMPDSPKSRRTLLSSAAAIRAKRETISDDSQALEKLKQQLRRLRQKSFPDLGLCRSAWEQFELFTAELRTAARQRSASRSTKFQLANESYAIVQDKVSQRLWEDLIV